MYGFKFGVIMRKLEFQVYSKSENFNKIFALKGYSEDYVHYLAPKLEKPGLSSGTAPGPVAVAVRSEAMVVP